MQELIDTKTAAPLIGIAAERALRHAPILEAPSWMGPV